MNGLDICSQEILDNSPAIIQSLRYRVRIATEIIFHGIVWILFNHRPTLSVFLPLRMIVLEQPALVQLGGVQTLSRINNTSVVRRHFLKACDRVARYKKPKNSGGKAGLSIVAPFRSNADCFYSRKHSLKDRAAFKQSTPCDRLCIHRCALFR